MIRVLTLIGVLFTALTPANQTPSSHIIVFVLEPNRPEQLLKDDATMMANIVEDSKQGELVTGVSTNGDEIFTFEGDFNQESALQQRRQKNVAVAQIKANISQLFDRELEAELTNDIATTLLQVMDYINALPSFERVTLVIFSGGLHDDGIISFKGAYPSYSWVTHQMSPFSAIDKNETTAKFQAIMVPGKDDFVNTYHARKIEDFYAVLFHQLNVEFVGFAYNHKTARQILERGGRVRKKPHEFNLNGELTLTEVGSLTTAEDDEANEQ